MPDSSAEKTEKATPKKRKDERKHGHVLQSHDVVTCAFIIIVFFTIRICAPLMLTSIERSMSYWLTICGYGMESENGTLIIDGAPFYMKLLGETAKTILLTEGPILLVSMAVTVIVTGAQTKWLFTRETMKFKLSKLNPIVGMKKFFSIKSLFEVAKNLIKMSIIVAIVYGQIKKRLPEFARLLDMDIQSGLVYLAKSVYNIIMLIGMVFVGIAAADYLFQRYTYEKDLKMTKQEVKEEFKNMEGDPKIKAKRRHIQMQMAMQRMMAAVPKADVVIKNPTHYAVAISYDPEKFNAPVVVAKGKDKVALRIIEIAAENDVITMENRPLARALYDNVEVDMQIPSEFYQSVAEVLAFVYGLKNKKPPIPKEKGSNY
jgi:flagellar biosynthetic protein FlhB